jgi:two-component system response regulator ChvI
MTHTIALVDDDRNILTSVSMTLEQEGFQVRTYTDGESALQGLLARPADLAVLDIKMPRMDGMELLQRLRQRSAMPVVFLTSKDEEVDELMGLRLGADDYITKPFNPRELLARVRAVLRRASRGGEAPATMGREVQMGKCRLNLDTRKLFEADGTEVPITSMEFDLLKCFAEHPRRVLSRDQLLDMAHSKEMEPFDRSIDTRIARIRRKIERDPAKPSCLKTVRAAGYCFNPEC